MLADLRPSANLSLTTSRLVLRQPDAGELAVLAALAAAGVHRPGERPYLTPWTEGTPAETAAHVLEQHRSRLRDWTPTAWVLELGLFVDNEPLGMVALRGQEFPTRREVKTESWLGLAHHRQGLGTVARSALLYLAFEGLSAQNAVTDVFRDNAGSQGVSRRLGYRQDGISHDVRDGQSLTSDRLRLNRDDWYGVDRIQVEMSGLAECLPLFGL